MNDDLSGQAGPTALTLDHRSSLVWDLIERASMQAETERIYSYHEAVGQLREHLATMEVSVAEEARLTVLMGNLRWAVEKHTGYPVMYTDKKWNDSATADADKGWFGYTQHSPRPRIEVSNDLPLLAQAYILLHETGHLICRHDERLVTRFGVNDVERAEVEAESVAWRAGTLLDLDVDEQCMLYLTVGGWARRFNHRVSEWKDVVQHVERASRWIVAAAEGRM